MSAENTVRAAEEILQRAEERLNHLEAAGLDARSLRKKFDRAKELYGKEQFDDVIRAAEEILVVTKTALEAVQDSLGVHTGKGKGGSRVMLDRKQVEETVARMLQEEIDQFIHSKALRAMLETIAREEAEERVGKVQEMLAELDAKVDDLFETMSGKVDASRVSSLESSVDEKMSGLVDADEVDAQVASLKKEIEQGIESVQSDLAFVPRTTEEDVEKIVVDALGSSGFASEENVNGKAASLKQEIASLKKEVEQGLESARTAVDEKLSTLASAEEVESVKSEILTPGQVEGLITSKLSPIESAVSSASRLTEEDVQRIVGEAVEAAGFASAEEVESKFSFMQSSLSSSQSVVDEKLASAKQEIDNKLSSVPRITEEDVQCVIDSAIASISKITEEDVHRVVSEAIEAVPTPPPAMTEEDVRRIAGEMIPKVETLTPDQIQGLVNEKVSALPGAEDIDSKIDSLKQELDNKLSSVSKITEDDVRRIVQEAVPTPPPAMTEEDVRRIAGEMIPKIETLTPEQIQGLVNEKVSALPGVEDIDAKIDNKLSSVSGITAEDVQGVIDGAVAAVFKITEEDVQRIVSEAFSSVPRIAEEDVQRIAQDLISKIEMPEQFTRDNIKGILTEVLASHPTVTEDDVRHIVQEAVPALPTALTEDDVRRIAGEAAPKVETMSVEAVENIIAENLEGSSDLTRENVSTMIDNALLSAGFVKAVDIESKLSGGEDVDSKIAALKEQIENKLSSAPRLTEDDVRRIAQEVAPPPAEAPAAAPTISPEEISKIVSGKFIELLKNVRAKLG